MQQIRARSRGTGHGPSTDGTSEQPARAGIRPRKGAPRKRRRTPDVGGDAYGSGLALRYGTAPRTTIANAGGQPLPPEVLAAAAGADNFSYSGGVLSWTVFTPGTGTARNAYYSYRLGSPAPSRVLVAGPESILGPDPYPFFRLDPSAGLYVDLRTGGRVTLPAGLDIAAVLKNSTSGDSVLFQYGSSKLGATGLSLVPLASLAPARC